MRILKENSLCLIIDVQDRLFPHMNNKEDLERNISILVKGMKILGIPLILTEQYPRGLGPTIASVAGLAESVLAIEKSSFSCCDEPVFMDAIIESKKNTFIIAGIEAHVCVMQTVLDLTGKGFNIVVVEDCISSRKLNDKISALRRMQHAGAIPVTYEALLFELTRISGTAQFKEISRLVK
jgi:nicotinamidase-related amidase